jgi:diaminohydroxyphosphoribosylaminopyrimidine deaminase / 5-amino-6-(5-phosphoribosylamino)uracil reductase
MKLTDQEAMDLAVAEGKKGMGWVEPNPPVGCVILDKNRNLIATGYHRQFGKPHAEIEALKNVKNKKLLEGAHLYVTLEPCAHIGKTPPCAVQLAKMPFASITYGRIDPNPAVKGKGTHILHSSGVKANKFKGDLSQINKLADMFCYSFENTSTFVTIKIASSLDGQMALKSGESQWITCEEARMYAHELRARHGAILVGLNTLHLDNPQLNVRHPKFKKYRTENKIVIVDPLGETLNQISKFKMAQSRNKQSIYVVTSNKIKPNEKFCQHIAVPLKGKFLDLGLMKNALFLNGIQSVLVEGGAFTVNQFLEQNQANKLCLFMAPSIIGAKGGLSWTSSLAIKKLSQKINLKNSTFETIGSDLLLTSYFDGAL